MGEAEIQISPGARERIEALAALSADGRETGGILLGRGPDPAGLLTVEIAGEPGPRATRERGFFLRDLPQARRLAATAWAERRAVWVGEWHTHPSGEPRPSNADIATYVRLLAAAELHFSLFAAIIVTPDPDPERGFAAPRLWPWLLELERPNAEEADLA